MSNTLGLHILTFNKSYQILNKYSELNYLSKQNIPQQSKLRNLQDHWIYCVDSICGTPSAAFIGRLQSALTPRYPQSTLPRAPPPPINHTEL